MLKRSVLKVSTFLMLLLSVVMVFAACGKMEFKVDFIVDDAVYATINTNGEEVLKMPNDPEKDGYVFDGWYWDKDSWKKPFSANSLLDAPLSSNMSVYAKWTTPEQVKGTQAEFAEFEKVTETEYSMKVSNSTASVSLGTLVTVNSRSSWTLSSDIYGNQTIASKTATLAVGDNTYYVLVTAENGATQLYTLKIRRRPVYSVIFDTSGGTAVENQKVEEDSFAEAPTTAKTGYSFVAWNYDFTNPITENKIVVASWKANTYKITYNTDGGDIEAKTADAVYDSAFTLKETTKRGYDFEGWYYGDNLITAGVWNYDTDITLEAHWHATEYTIRYDLGGGIVNGVNPLQYTVEDSNITLVNPTKAGYIFAGWTGTDLTAPTLTVIIGANSIGNREYVANWTLDGYSITYNLNGGVNSEKNPSEYAVTSANIYLESATRRGYVFDGWYTNTGCTADAKITTITSGSTGDITLWAKWTLANYNITYNLNGGEFTSDNPKNYTIESGDITLNAPTKRGYTFVGWMGTDITGTVISVTIRNNSTGDRTYTAVWEIVDYSIIYNLNGGTNASENLEKYNVASATITLENPTKLGYVFGGWYTSNDYNDDERVKVIPNGSIGNIELFAKWTPATYSIKFNKNNSKATGTMSNQTLTYDSADTLTANRFVLTGYTFKGWTTNSDGSGTLYINEQEVLNLSSEDGAIVNVYAKWEANTYSVTFDKNGGVNGTNSVSAIYDSAMPTATAPTYTGYNFAGYYDADGVQYYDAEMQSVRNWNKAENTTLYARWNGKTFNVSFDRQGGTGGTTSVAATFNANMPSASAPSRTGYIFKGYFDGRNGTGTQYYSASMSSLHKWDKSSVGTLYAYWEARTYTVSFNYNNGNGNNGSVIATYDSEMPSISGVPTRTGYIFAGYYDSANNGTKYYNADLTSAKTWDKTSNTILYAHWVGVDYSVRFDGNGSTSGRMDNQAFVYATAQNLNANRFARTGYTFVGWNTEADGSGTSYDNSASVNNLTAENNGTVVLYAQWSANTYRVSLDEMCGPQSYTVEFNLNGGTGNIVSQTVTESNPLIYPNNPTRSGFIFGGWYLDPDCTERYEFNGVLDGNLSLYARWTSCAISNDSSYPWNLSNGVLTSTNKRDNSSSTYKITAPVALTVSFSYKVSSEAKYDFLIIKKNGSELKKLSGSTSYVSYSVDLNANDYLTFTYSKDHSQSSGSDCAYISEISYISKVSYSSNVTVGQGIGRENLVYGSAFTLPVDISKVGYTFAGWYDGIGGTGTQYTDAEGNSVRVWDKAENTTLYPKWNVNQYTISFVSNGGSTVDSITQDYGSAVTTPTKPTWSEKSFVGWFTDSSLTNEYHFTTMPAENITLYAKWIEYSVSISCDDTTEISVGDAVTSPDTYNATAIDTDGNSVNITVSVIGGTFATGKTVTVRLVANGLYGAYATKTISNIKVYGIPTLSYDTEKDYFNLSDTLNASLWGASATDTFGTALFVSVSVKESNYSAGDLVTIIISATDITGNEAKVEIANVKVYGAPVITRDTTKNDMKATDTVGNELFGVSAVDSFGVVLTVTTVKQSGTISGGNTITVKSSATDSKGNTYYITYTVKVYGLPTIGGATKTSFKVDDTISLDTLGIIAKDSFNNRLSTVTLTLTEGVQTAGQTLTYLVTATDHLGNVQTRTISGIRIYGTPTILFDTAKGSMKVTDTVNANLFSAVAKDSHNGELVVTVTVESGTIAGGNVVKFRLSTVDALGNEYSIVTQDVKVYSSDNITLTYNAAASTRIKKASRGEEFGASAVNGFGEACAISIEAAAGYTLAGGNTINLYIVATDALGNTTKSALITGIKIYDTPTLSFAREYPYIQNGDSPYELFRLTDSFGAEVLYDITIVSGSLDVNETIVYKITGTDRVGNVFEETRELVVLDTNESILELYKNGVKIGTQRVYKNGNFTLPCDTGYYTVWYYSGVAITDNTGSSLGVWTNDSNGYVVTTTPVAITYNISYTLNNGTNSAANPFNYTIESGNITLVAPTRAGYTFIGWTGTDLADKTMTVVIPTGSYGNRTYTANWQANNYTITFDANGGNVNVDSQTVTFDLAYTLPTPTRTGYTFAGWFNGDTKYNGGTWTTASDITLTAKWTANTNTIYTVNHYLQNIENDEYSFYEAQTLRGTSDTSVSPSVKNYTGFTAPAVQTVNVNPDGSRVVNYYYTRNYYTITVVGNGGTNNTIRQKYQSAIDTTGWTTRNGYTLGGLYADISLSIPYTDTTMPAQNKTVYAYWTGDAVAADFTYTSATSGITITGYSGSSTIVKIPEQIGGVKVIAIAASAFANNTTIQSVVVPNSVESIGAGAFKGCNGLTSVSLPFVGKSRTASAYEAVFGYIFGYTTATRNTYSYEYNTSGSQWGSNSGVSSSNNDFVDRIVGTNSSVYLPTGTTWQYSCRNGHYSSSSYYYLQSYYYYVPSTLTNVVITDATVIPEEAFYNCANITSVTLNNGVKTIGTNAFENSTKLESADIGTGVTAINSDAFKNCSALKSITIPSGVTTISAYAFYNNTALASVSLPSGITAIDIYAFYGTTSLKELVFPSELTTIGSNAFNGTRIRVLNIPSKVKSIGSAAFAGDVALTSLTIPGNVETISDSAFSGCVNITSLTLRSGIKTIGAAAFNGIKITSLVVPNSVESIGAGAFKGCNSLTSVSLPFVGKSRTASAYEAVFGYIFGYTTATRNTYSYEYNTSGSQWGSNSGVSSSNNDFVDRIVGTNSSVYLPTGTTWQYSCRNGHYSSSSYYYLQSYYYYVPSTLTNVVITDATVIPEEAFYNCANITSVTLNNGVKTIGTNAFENSTKLESADIGTGVTAINSDAFKNCSALKSIIIPYGVNSMGSYVFANCSVLSINCQIEEQPSAWTSTWNSSFRPVTWGYGCERGTTAEGIKWISIDGKTVRIVGYEGTATTLTIPTTIDGKVVNRIAANAFEGNTNLTSIVIPDGIIYIETKAFADMTNLVSVEISSTVTEIQANAFTGCTKVSVLCRASAKHSGWSSSWNSSNRPIVWKYAGTEGVTSDGLKWASVTGDTVVIYGYSGSSASVTIPTTINDKTVSGISENAFRSNTTITSVFIPTCIEYIGSGAFVGCSSLTINCEIASAPSGWSSSWKDSSTTVYWSM